MGSTKSPYSREENEEAWTAWECLTRTGVSIFLTGRAGTGKTTFLKRLREASLRHMVVVAPTGVAAINAGGVTIHSFFQIAPSLNLPGTPLEQSRTIRRSKLKLMRSIDLLVVDEVSMVRPDLLDAVDARLRQVRHNDAPFGGVQLLLIGDLMQLSPVVKAEEEELLRSYYPTPYFFSSRALQQVRYHVIELRHIYRQTEQQFIGLLNKVRNNDMSDDDLRLLNSRYKPGFDPADGERYIRLTTHNATADGLNTERLARLGGAPHVYECATSGTFPEKAYPAESRLTLKEGAQVMFLKNDPQGRFFNGKIGRVTRLGDEGVTVSSDDEHGEIEVRRDTWQNISYNLNKDTGEVEQTVEGTFSQLPLRLAWSITIHKSQGLTFDRAIIDAGSSFSPGQVYVALSRCRSFEGMVLSTRISRGSIMTDRSVEQYMGDRGGHRISREELDRFASDYAVTVMADLFDFRSITVCAHRIMRLLEESYSTTYPALISEIGSALSRCDTEICAPAQRFSVICRQCHAGGGDIVANEALMARAANGAKYFESRAREILDPLVATTALTLNNKEVERRRSDLRASLVQELTVKHATLRVVANGGFNPTRIVAAKAMAISKEPDEESLRAAKVEADEREVTNKDLYKDLKTWRTSLIEGTTTPAYTILSNAVLMNIADTVPTSLKELRGVKGLGDVKIEKYGADLLAVIGRHFAKGARAAGREQRPKMQRTKKEPRTSTVELSVEAFKRLGDIDAVAKERGLARSTIAGHLVRSIGESGLDIDDIMGAERHRELRRMVEAMPEGETQFQKETMSGKFEYSEFRYVLDEVRGGRE